ncbi:uncharacterized protein LOC114719367 isoform X2 [Neltuma alba]|uniref:uncharacterized protein LOC114719367 isoform X2 n=1 Tax=Neltuma alba TaxID=207710 RepID=UPI0010A498AE|nr:uncharacterized protein LOC114719367 isoform X2 [Prosopis alba]
MCFSIWKGTNKIEAITLDLPENIEVQWSGEAFVKMKSLKMLVIKKACFSEYPKYLPKSLRWLEWKGYSFKFLPSLCATELVYLDLSFSFCELLQPFDKKFRNLSSMKLRNCQSLLQIPDLSGASNLRELWLDGCTNLIGIHESVGCLEKLRELSAMRCEKLKILPSCLRLTSLRHLNLFGCSSLQTFPEVSVMMVEMQTLDLDKTAITELPSSICNLVGLEILHMEECPNLMQLPASICTLPNLWKLTANSCERMSDIKMCEGGDKASSDLSATLLKMEQLCFSNCNLSDDSLTFCLSYFSNMIYLDLSLNNFMSLPECIKEYHNLKYLFLDHCDQLQHIREMPPNLEKFSAICCTSLTKLSKSKVLKQVFNFQSGKRNFILPGNKFPERLHYYSRGSFVSFWVRNVFPMAFLWILVKDDQDYVYNFKLSVHFNNTKLDISSEWLLLSTIKTDHIFICDMRSIIHSTELPLQNKWNQVKVSLESKTPEIKGEKGICFGVHVHDLQSNLANIQFRDPRRYADHNLLLKIQEQEDWKELEGDMSVDSNSTKSAESTDESLMHYQVSDSTPLDLWEIGEVIGRGSSGIVHHGVNRETGESCAIKEMRYIGNPGVAESLHREVQVFSRLEHQNIVKYYGSEIEGSRGRIYMELVQPGSLKKYITYRGALQESLVRDFTAQILSGLVYLHRRRVVHRDIKPHNILVDSKNNVKLADFALAEQLAESAGQHSTPGTLYYAAPEVLKRIEYKSWLEAYAADIWSLGCVIIEMFSGEHPWHDLEPVQVFFNVHFKEQHPPIPEELSQEGKDFLQLCFQKTPADRPSAAALLDHPFVKAQTT